MTYDQVIDLARKMTRTQDGVQYIGWEPGFPDANASPFSQPFVDTKTNKALIDTPAYKKVFEMMKAGYDIPGFIGPKDLFRYAPKAFTDDHTVSMYVDWYNKLSVQLIAAEANGSAPNWDIVTVPNFPEFANVGRHESVQFLLVSKQTPYKDQALQVIQAATSKEAQLLQSRNGRISILNDPDMLKEFGKDVKAFQGKHLENLFKFKPAPSAKATVYDDEMRAIVRSAIKEVAVNKKDVNTVLRQAQEAADKKLAEMMKK
jgi:multiple sugar transport system substrate-binding protein